MISYITLGTNDIKKAAEFYDDVLGAMGATRIFDTDQFIGWGTGSDAPIFSVTMPFDGNPATVGNGVMIALKAESTELVDAIHAKALLLGATDEGAPGKRGDAFYCGYFRDLDGNKINLFFPLA